MAIIPFVVYMLTFLLDPRIGLPFLLVLALLVYRRARVRRLETASRQRPPKPPQKAWVNPWGTDQSS